MYLHSVRLQNVKCFENVEINFQSSHNGDRQSNWNVILGNNADGKTSLLQAIAACLVDSTTAERLAKPNNWVRAGKRMARITAKLARTDDDKQSGRPPLEEKTERTLEYLIVGANQELPLASLLSDANKRFFPTAAIIEPSPDYMGLFENAKSLMDDIDYLKRNAFVGHKQRGWMSCGYGAFRRISGFASHTVNIDDMLQKRFLTLFEEGAALYDCETWLKELDRKATKSKQGSAQRRAIDEVKSTLCELLPEVDDLVIAEDVRFLWRGGEVDLNQLSDGYRSMFALIVDLMRWLDMFRPPDVALREVSGIVLIDEIDSHLHPRWQREAGFLLTRVFPNIQFVVTTHSPFVAMAAGKGALTLLENEGMSVVANQEVPYVRGWTVDRVLTDLFAMVSMRDPETEQKIQDYERLRFERRKGTLNDANRAVLDNLEAELNARLRNEPEAPSSRQMDEDLQFFANELKKRRQETVDAAS